MLYSPDPPRTPCHHSRWFMYQLMPGDSGWLLRSIVQNRKEMRVECKSLFKFQINLKLEPQLQFIISSPPTSNQTTNFLSLKKVSDSSASTEAFLLWTKAAAEEQEQDIRDHQRTCRMFSLFLYQSQ